MRLDKIKVNDQVIIFQPHTNFYINKQHKALTDPTAIGFEGIVISISQNYYNEDIIWVKLSIDNSMIECYAEELVPFWGYTALDIRDAPELPNWIHSEEELVERIYRFEWKKEDWQKVFQHMFTNINEVRKHLDWLRTKP